jgi:hypothetical protein
MLAQVPEPACSSFTTRLPASKFVELSGAERGQAGLEIEDAHLAFGIDPRPPHLQASIRKQLFVSPWSRSFSFGALIRL